MQNLINFNHKRSTLRQTAYVFIFACYTGLSWIDVKNLNQNHIVQGIDGNKWIYMAREKTDTPVKIPILPKAQEILDNYAEQEQKTGFLLPVYSNQKTNKYLKEIAKELKVTKKITSHVLGTPSPQQSPYQTESPSKRFPNCSAIPSFRPLRFMPVW